MPDINRFQEFLQSVYPELIERIIREDGLCAFHHFVNKSPVSPLTELPEDPAAIDEQIHVIASMKHWPIPESTEKPVVVILAAGKGSRMGCKTRQKSLCPIAGRPALLRAMDMYRSLGIGHFVIIVGIGYKDVIHCIGEREEGVSYLFQDVQLGTGHAGRLAARFLRYSGYQGDVLIAMGDKFITHRGIERLFRDHAANQPDLTISTASKTAWPDSGRVVQDEKGRVVAIVEKPDIIQKRLMHDFYQWPDESVPSDAFLQRAKSYWNRPDKLKKLLGTSFWDALNTLKTIPKTFAGLPLNPDKLLFKVSDSMQLLGSEVESMCDRVNISVYLFKAHALYESTGRLQFDNAQGELYLTDAVLDLTTHCNPHLYTIITSDMPDDYDVMGFNTPEELEQIERLVEERHLLENK